MTSPALADLLLSQGRRSVGPVVERYLARLTAAGRLDVSDPGEAFRLLYGLVIRDSQIRVLLGEPAPSTSAIDAQATDGVHAFLRLVVAQR